jgi:hypothetical protein
VTLRQVGMSLNMVQTSTSLERRSNLFVSQWRSKVVGS